jgi:probable F420-dependent oxidoreductase
VWRVGDVDHVAREAGVVAQGERDVLVEVAAGEVVAAADEENELEHPSFTVGSSPTVRSMRLAVTLPGYGSFLPPGELHRVVELARLAEGAGVDQVVLPDHVVMGARTDRYQWGPFPYPPDTPWLEPLTTLAAIAGATDRVRLSTGILVAPIRPAILLAKSAATLDVLSHGRLDLGVGTGWQAEELEAAGVPYAERGRRLTDTVAACRELWANAPASFESPTVRFRDVWCEPRPLRPGGVPVWFAGSLTDRMLRRVVDLGDGWIPIMGATPEGIAADVARLRAALAGAGRDPDRLDVRAPLPARGRDLAEAFDDVPAYAAAGVTYVSVNLTAYASEPGEAGRVVSELARRFGPYRD